MARRAGPTSLAMFRICRKLRGFRGWKPASMTQARLMQRSIATPLETWNLTSSRLRTTERPGRRWWPRTAVCTGPNPPDAAQITYYQSKRHIFGKMKLEIFDSQGKLVDTLPPNSRRGISRVAWPMRLKAPHVPPAATAAFEAAQGPRVMPGTYTVRMTRGTETYSIQLVVGLDPRAKFTVEDRKLEFDAAMRLHRSE